RFAQSLLPVPQLRRDCLQLCGPLRHALFELPVQTLELARLAEQVDEDAHLRPQDLGNDRDGHIVHGPAGVALEAIELGEMDARDENDRRLLEPWMLAHHPGELEAV